MIKYRFGVIIFITGVLFISTALVNAKEDVEIVIQTGHNGCVRSLTVTPDEKTIVSGGIDNTIRLWDLETGKEIRKFNGHTDSVESLALTADGKSIVSGSYDHTIRLWDLETGKEIRQYKGHTDAVNSVAITADGKSIVSGSGDHTIRLWDLQTGKELRKFKGHTNWVRSVAITADGKSIVSGSSDKTIRLWDLNTGKEIRQFKGHTNRVYLVAITPDGKVVVSKSFDCTIRLWNLETGKEIRQFKGHTQLTHSFAITADGKSIVSGSFNSTILLWDLETGKGIRTFNGHTDSVESLALTADGKSIVSGSWDNTIRLWDLETGKAVRQFKRNTWGRLSVAITADGKSIVSRSGPGTIRQWSLATGKEMRRFNGNINSVHSVAITSNGKSIVSGSDDQTIRLWDLETGKEIRKFNGHTWGVNSVAITSNGKSIVSGSDDQTIRLWDLETGKEIRKFNGHTWVICSVAITADGKSIVSGSGDRTIRLWDLETGKEVRQFKGHTSWVTSVAITSNGKSIVSGSWDNTIRLWDLETGKEIRQFKGHTDHVNSVAVTADGKIIVSGSDDNTVRLWDLETGKESRQFKEHTYTVSSVAITADGKSIVSCSWDGEIKIWNLEKEYLMATIVVFQDGEWITYTPNNYYTTSPKGDQYISFRVGSKVYSFEQYSAVFNKEEVVIRVLKGENIDSILAELDMKNIEITKIPAPVVVIKYLEHDSRLIKPESQTVNTSQFYITASVNGLNLDIDRVIIFLNDKAIIKRSGKGKIKIDLKELLTLGQRENKIKITAYNREGVKGYSEEIFLTYSPLSGKARIISFEDPIPKEWSTLKRLRINGKDVKVERIDQINRYMEVIPLGENRGTQNLINQGLNKISAGIKTLLLWSERGKLKSFKNPYKDSHAILVAIDDYDRNKDPKKRGKTGFKDLKGTMVKNAEKLKAVLLMLGFSYQNIRTFYNQKAESGMIESALMEFWDKPSGRLFFYFGGHGYTDKEKDNGYLVTYDYNPERVSRTAIPMEDLTIRHAREVLAHHMLIALDTCYSGLSIRNLGDKKNDEAKIREFQKLSIIRSYTEPKARNVLLASIGDQEAFWKNGGIFTRHLIDGLSGKADLNRDNIVQFGELDIYVTNKVIQETSLYGRKQIPVGYPIRRFGDGKVIFIIPYFLAQ